MNRANDLLRCVDPNQFKGVLARLKNPLAFEHGESWESHTMFLCQVVVELHAMLATEKSVNLCDVCCGDGKLQNCICGGTGRMSDAAHHLRKMLQAVELPQEEDWQERCNRFRVQIGPNQPSPGDRWYQNLGMRVGKNVLKVEAVVGNLIAYSSNQQKDILWSTKEDWQEHIKNFSKLNPDHSVPELTVEVSSKIGPPPNYKPQYGEVWRDSPTATEYKIEGEVGNIVFYSSTVSNDIGILTIGQWTKFIRNFRLIQICGRVDGL